MDNSHFETRRLEMEWEKLEVLRRIAASLEAIQATLEKRI